MTLQSEYFQIYNFVLIGYLFFALIEGYRKGFLRLLLDVAVNLGGIAAAFYFADFLYMKYPLYQVESSANKDTINLILWFLILQLTIRGIYSSVAVFVRGVEMVPGLSFVNRLGGIVLSLVLVLISLYMLTIFLKLEFVTNGTDFIHSSILRYFDVDIQTILRFLAERGIQL